METLKHAMRYLRTQDDTFEARAIIGTAYEACHRAEQIQANENIGEGIKSVVLRVVRKPHPLSGGYIFRVERLEADGWYPEYLGYHTPAEARRESAQRYQGRTIVWKQDVY